MVVWNGVERFVVPFRLQACDRFGPDWHVVKRGRFIANWATNSIFPHSFQLTKCKRPRDGFERAAVRWFC